MTTRIDIPVRARATGAFPLLIDVRTPDGRRSLSTSRYTVRSTAVSGVGLLLSVGAGVFLTVWWARHWRRTRRSRKLIAEPHRPPRHGPSTGRQRPASRFAPMPVRIVTDSSCDLTDEEVAKHGVEVVPLSIRFGEDEYEDRSELSVEDFYAKLADASVLPETAAPAPGQVRGRVPSPAAGRRRRGRVHQPQQRAVGHDAVRAERRQGARGRARRPGRRLALDHLGPRHPGDARGGGGGRRRVGRRRGRAGGGPRRRAPTCSARSTRSTT